MKSCFMFGHTDCPDSMLPAIEETIEQFYQKFEIRIFYVGNRRRFDSLAATAVKRVKRKYPDISLRLVLACHPGARPVSLSEGFDGSYYPPLEGIPRRYAIVRANRHMVCVADSLICCVCHGGNTRNLLEYARNRKNLPITNAAQFPL